MKFGTLLAASFGMLAVLIGTSGQSQAGETLQRVLSTGVLTNVAVNDYPPFDFLNDKNELVGFDIDVAQAVADRLGVKLKNETPGWETIVGGKWKGRWDACICSMTPSTDRAEVLDFPIRYYSSPAVLVVNKNDTAIKSVSDISGKRVGVGTGSSYEAYLDKTLQIPGAKPITFPFENVVKVPSDETVAFQNLALGAGIRLDAIVANLATTKERIDATGQFKIVGAPLYGEPNWVATDKGDPEWEAKLVEVIKALRADGTLARISQKWLGADVTGDDL
jgi:polar amino acid transport system substrate-binding protein